MLFLKLLLGGYFYGQMGRFDIYHGSTFKKWNWWGYAKNYYRFYPSDRKIRLSSRWWWKSDIQLFLIELIYKMPLQNFKGPSPNAQVIKYMHQFIVHHVYYLHRKRPRLSLDIDDQNVLDKDAEKDISGIELRSCIALLEQKQKTVIYLRYWYGFSI